MTSKIGAVVVPRRGRGFVMVRHRDRSWEFPGGMLKPGETPLQAAKRELMEETGLAGEGWRSLGALPGKDLEFFTCLARGKIRPDGNEIIEARVLSAPPADLSFPRDEIFELLRRTGARPKPKVDYDEISARFDEVRVSDPEVIGAWVEKLVGTGGIGPSSTVADIGCGTGRYTLEIAGSAGARVLGLDYSEGMLCKARAKARGMWARADAQALPVRGSAVDAAVLMLVLQHLNDEALALAEAFRILRPGGRLVVVTTSHARIRRHVMRHFPGMVAIDLCRFMPVPELRWHLARAGFSGVRTERLRLDLGERDIDKVIGRFRDRYISTLSLVPEGEFERRMKIFEKALREEYGPRIPREVELTYLSAIRP